MSKSFKIKYPATICLGLFAAYPFNVAFAQSQPASVQPSNSNAAPGVADIVVTARRTEEKLKNVPLSVTALGAEALRERGVSSEVDLQVAVPGLLNRQSQSNNQINFALRGQSIDAYSSSSSAVLPYLNEVQIGGQSATSFFDLEAIQVLKGPQGTLFGRNTTGGAVLYSTAKPKNDFEGYVMAGYGNYNNIEVEGALNIPLADGIAVRIAGRSQTRDGFQHDLIHDTYVNSIDSQVGRISLLIAPVGSRFSNITVVQQGHFRGTNGALKLQNAYGVDGQPTTYFDPITNTTKPLRTTLLQSYPAGVPLLDSRVSALFNGLADYVAKQKNYGFYDVFSNSNLQHRADQTFVSNTTTYELTDKITIKNIFGYNNARDNDQIDVTGSPFQFIAITTPVGPPGFFYRTKDISEELQISGQAGKIKFVGGLYYYKQKEHDNWSNCVLCDINFGETQPPQTGFLGDYDYIVTDTQKAVYGQATYSLTDKLNLSGGIRYTWANTKLTFPADPYSIQLGAGLQPGTASFHRPSWLGGLDYHVTNELMLYFTQRGSWRAGGFNPTSFGQFPNADKFTSETTYDFEVGAKFGGFIGPLRTNIDIAVYDQNLKHLQRAVYINANPVSGSVGSGRVRGVEFDGTIFPSSHLELGISGAYTDARFLDNTATLLGQTTAFGPYGDTPKWSGSAHARISTRLAADGGEIALRAEIYGESSYFYSNLTGTENPNAVIPGYALANATLEWNGVLGSKVDGTLYVNNLTGRKYLAGGFALGTVTGSNAVLPGTPRMFGAKLRVKF